VAIDDMFRLTWPSSGITHCTKEILGSKSSKCRKVHPMSDKNEEIFVATADYFNTL